jgi:7-carboxy-7-deazaguanine synthase
MLGGIWRVEAFKLRPTFAPKTALPDRSATLKLARLHGQPEIFHSIQGEGKSVGQPSVFVRTSLCNLHCIWCDTDYTWNWVGTRFAHVHDARAGYQKFVKKDWIAECAVTEVADAVARFGCENIILTGGEPMLQQPALVALANLLRSKSVHYRFEVETNGTLAPLADFDAAIDQYNVSPKLENSANPRRLREKPAALRFFAASPKANFKFVVAEKSDLDEVLVLLKTYAIAPEKVWLMPEGTSAAALAKRRKWLVEICKQHGFRYSDRLHVQIWGAKKGV